ncbi:MAG: tetratricopeptide repeat protein, partial [Flavobacterium sp.]
AIAQYNKGIEYVNKEKYEDAIPYFKKAVSIDPKFAFAWDNLGISYRKTSQYDKALEAYNKSLEIDPEGKMPLQNIPVVYQYLEQYDKALDAYDNLLKVSPNDPETFYGKGLIYTYYKKDHEKALAMMCKAYNLYATMNSPYRVDAQKIIQTLYSEMKKDGKEETFNKILKENNISTKK